MTSLTIALDAELRKPSPTVFGAIAVDLPGYSLNLLDGSGVLSFAGRTFTGKDPVFGTIAAVETISDGFGDTVPAVSITFLPASDASAASLAGPTMQGSPVYIYVGAVDPVTGIPIPDPHLLALMELDVPTLHKEPNARSLEYECVSVFVRLFEDDEGARLAPGFHKSIWPGELALDEITGVTQTYYWGVEGVNITGAVTYVGAAAILPHGGLFGAFE
jgi:hypothetical protein